MQKKVLLLLLICLIGLTLWAWAPSLSVGFLADDYEWFAVVSKLRFFDTWKLFWLKMLDTPQARYRPITGLLFWIDWRLWKYIPIGYHLTNLLLHLFTTIGVYHLAKVILVLLGRKKYAVSIGFLSASLFLLNPLATQAVTWIDGRYDVLAGCFYTWALFLFCKAFVSPVAWKQKSVPPNASFVEKLTYGLQWKWIVAAVVLTALSLFAKEMAIVMPFQVALILLGLRSTKEKLLTLPLLFGMVVVAYFIFGSLALGQPIWSAKGYSAQLSLSRPFLVWLLLTLTGSMIHIFTKYSFPRKFITWFFIGVALLPLAPLPTEMRFLYVPSIFAMIWLASAIAGFFQQKFFSQFSPIYLALIIITSFFLHERNMQWARASQFQQMLIHRIQSFIAEEKPQTLYVFNLPDSIGEVPLFRTYAENAILIDKSFPKIIAGPVIINPAFSTAQRSSTQTIELTTQSHFLIFSPTITRQASDGSIAVNWQNEWTGEVLVGRKKMSVQLSEELTHTTRGLYFNGITMQELR